MTTVYLIRHGRTDAVGRHLAQAAVELNDAGRAQVQGLVERLHGVRFDAVLASPLPRTWQSADPVARDHGLAVTVVPELTEFDFGSWSGQTFAALEGNERWRRFNAARAITSPPGGESMLAVQHRAVAALLAARDRYPDGTIAVVSHGDVIRAALLYFLGMPIDFVHRLELSPGGISVMELGEASVRVRQVNGDSAPPAE
jgi:broad specificity phosphatase PhoE